MPNPIMVEGTFYLTLSQKRGRRFVLGTPKITVMKPNIPKGHIAMKLNFQVPEALFTQFIPEGSITLPADADIGRPEIDVAVPAELLVSPDVRLALVGYVEPSEEEDDDRS